MSPLPGDNLTDTQVATVRQKLRAWWPNGHWRGVNPVLVAMAEIAGCSISTLRAFKTGIYHGNNRIIAQKIADFLGIKLN